MPDGGEAVEIQVASRIADVPADHWDACAGPGNPFISHAFLSALEDSGSATAETGWLPQHLSIADSQNRLLGCAPLYLKNHSFGEYVFDWGWADAYERAGGAYYPKLQACVPFTPATGPRLLVRPDTNRDTVADLLVGGLLELARRHQVSSLHVTFPDSADWQRLGTAGFLQRSGLQYHWENKDYGGFDDFLASLSSRKRKAIKRERRKVVESGITLRTLTGDAIEPRHWAALHHFYLETADRKWGQPYLTESFFQRLGQSMAEQIVLVMAEDRGDLIAGALHIRGGDTLYGRNWGALGHWRFLHFEACYYRAIDFAVAQGLRWVEAGAQGEHKIQRGYLPVETYSAHWIADPALRDPVANFIRRERDAIGYEKAVLTTHGPFREEK